MENDFLENTYRIDEIIVEFGPKWDLAKNSAKVTSLNKGRCYTVAFPSKVKANDMNLTLALHKSTDYDLFLHQSGKEG